MSVLSVGLVAGPSSPARRDLLTEDSTSCGANRRCLDCSRCCWYCCLGGSSCTSGGDAERGEGLGVGSPAGTVFRYRSKVVSMGIGANLGRGLSLELAITGGKYS